MVTVCLLIISFGLIASLSKYTHPTSAFQESYVWFVCVKIFALKNTTIKRSVNYNLIFNKKMSHIIGFFM